MLVQQYTGYTVVRGWCLKAETVCIPFHIALASGCCHPLNHGWTPSTCQSGQVHAFYYTDESLLYFRPHLIPRSFPEKKKFIATGFTEGKTSREDPPNVELNAAYTSSCSTYFHTCAHLDICCRKKNMAASVSVWKLQESLRFLLRFSVWSHCVLRVFFAIRVQDSNAKEISASFSPQK